MNTDNNADTDIDSLRQEVSDLRNQQKQQAKLLLLFGKLLNKNNSSTKVASSYASSTTGDAKDRTETKSSSSTPTPIKDEAEHDLVASSNKSVQAATQDLSKAQHKGRVQASERTCRMSKVGFIEFEGQASPLGSVGLCCSDKQSAGLLLVNCLLTPFLLIVHSIRIYLFPCLTSCLFQCCCALGSKLCGKCWRYKDKQFPPNDASLGNFEGKTNNKVDWKRAHEIIEVMPKTSRCDRTAAQLFEDGISPKDIAQGALGDCWLLSAIACLAEQRGSIERCFMEHSYNPRGKYTMKLWDGLLQKWMYIQVDDSFPCQEGEGGKPLFTHPNGGEIWVMLLEKAFAKMSGSYANIEGGHVLWALEAMTGDDVLKYSLSKEKTTWSSYELVHKKKDATTSGVRGCRFPSTGHTFDNDNMFVVLKKYSQSNCVLGAGSLGVDNTRKEGRPEGEKSDEDQQNGIVPGHAYSILDVRHVFGHRLVCLRNPWGAFEWKGDWSDTSKMWKTHPLVRALLKPETMVSKADKDDGLFWMSWEDFLKYFSSVDVCITSRGMQELRYHVYEEFSFFGPVLGCVVGCFTYWICCCGLYKLWCSRTSNKTFVADGVEEVQNKG